MAYTVIIPPYVENQMLDAALFISQDSPDRAFAWYERTINQLKQSLGEFPRAHEKDEQVSRVAGEEIRKYTIGNYRTRYTIEDDAQTVTLVDFQHGAMQPEKPE